MPYKIEWVELSLMEFQQVLRFCPAMLHGGPYPSSTDSRFTAVGLHSVKRWVRPFSFQSWPNELLPAELKNNNPLGITRFVNGLNTSNKI